MQASKPDGVERRFECLTCQTTIVERPSAPPAGEEAAGGKD